MKKISLGIVHLLFMLIVVIYLIVSLSSCSSSEISLNGKELIIDKMKRLSQTSINNINSDTSNLELRKGFTKGGNVEVDDFRYKNIYK